MSPIGRVFIVLNLLLSGAFIYFSGAYLQQATNWKEKYNLENKKFVDLESKSAADLAEKISDLNAVDRNLRGITSTLAERDNLLKEKNAEIERQNDQLANIQGNLQKLEANFAVVSKSIDVAVAESAKARTDWMAADQAKAAAIRDKETSDAALAEAKMKIEATERDLAAKAAEIAALTEKTKQDEVLITLAKQRMPDIFVLAQPTYNGVVSNVSRAGDLVTINITENKANLPLKPGANFAIFESNVYKGEATVTDVMADGTTAFASVTFMKDGSSVKAGDRASTNPAGR